MTEDCLIIFSKNPVLGKVKTRLAKTIGDEKALEMYRILQRRTRDVTKNLDCFKKVYYSDYINCEDLWDSAVYKKGKQIGEDLGERMYHAIEEQFLEGFSKVMIIGTDCYELSTEIIEEAFQALDNYDAVIGPAYDGGFYLLGMKNLRKNVFINKEWSTSKVFENTFKEFEKHNDSIYVLQKLSDVDEEKDLATIKETVL